MGSRLANLRTSLVFFLASVFVLPLLWGFSASSQAAVSYPLTFTDLAGREVTIEKAPERIIVAQYIVNYMMVGGAGSLSKVVGMTFDGWQDTRLGEYAVFTQSFPKLKEIPSIGGYHDSVLDAEKIIALKPDLVLIDNSQFTANDQRVQVFENSGIKVVVLDYHSMKIETHCKSTQILGDLLGREEVAKRQIDTYTKAIEELHSKLKTVEGQRPQPRVYVELGNKGVNENGNSYNNKVLWGAIVSSLGGDNLAKNMEQPYAPLDNEFILASDPQIIFVGGSIWSGSEGDQMRMGFTVDEKTALERLKGFAKRPAWAHLTAVKDGQIYAVDHGSLRNMGDYVFSQFIAKVMYPDLFPNLRPEENINSYFKDYLPELKYTGVFMLGPLGTQAISN
ncbi:MAG: ABC transporter substrate-binding protein [Deltaproteobacteria bacterium]|jgi:ABC-type Fe3+-hydroxamate transport system substrate-binding protein|nr:ABC transporter substrate-binding protein [Deltaproteobacteria bacterium]